MKFNQTLTTIVKKCKQTLVISLAFLPMLMGNNPAVHFDYPDLTAASLEMPLPKGPFFNQGVRNISTPHFSNYISSLFNFNTEICNNGIDDDGDGLTDDDDPDCACTTTIMLVARDNGNILQVNLETSATTIVNSSPFTNGNLNALAANPDNNLVYYCRDKIVYYWDPVTEEQDTVINLQGKIGSSESLSSGGGGYYNGHIYLGTEKGNPGINPNVWQLKLSTDGRSYASDPVDLNVAIPSHTSWGDMIISAEGGQTVIYGMTASGTSYFWKYNVTTSNFDIIRNDLPTEMQIGVDIYGNTWAGSLSSGMIQKLNRATGYFYGNVVYFGGRLWDLTGPINCPQAIEICDNGLDDDGDGYTDNQDQDCLCPSITTPDATTLNTCEGELVTFNVSSNAPNPPYTHIRYYRFTSPQANPYTTSDPKALLGEIPNTGSGSFSTNDFPVVNATQRTFYVYAQVHPTPQYPGTCAPFVEYILHVKDGPGADVSIDVTQCEGQTTQLSASATGAAGPYTYVWNQGLGSGSTHSVVPASTTTYTVTVTAGNGCTDTDATTVYLVPSPTVNAGTDQEICSGGSATLIANASGGVGPYTYTWSQNLGEGATQVVSPTTTKTYSVMALGSNGCAGSDEVTVTVTTCFENCNNNKDDDGDGLVDCDDPDCSLTVDLGAAVTICAGTSTTLTADASGGTGGYTYVWSDGLGTGAAKTVTPAGNHTYTVTATSSSGCTGVGEVTVFTTICTEDCTNGIDDDGDGLVDCDDPDCQAVGAPQLNDDAYTSCPGLPVTERVTYNDANLQDPVFTIALQPSNGFVSIDHTGKFVYTPFETDCSTDLFMYRVCNLTTGCCAEAVVTLNIGDVTPPSLLNVPSDLTIGCDDAVPPPTQVLAYDACPGIFLDFEETSTEHQVGACETFTITRTWTAADMCGNTSSDEQVITVQDLTAPEIFRVYTLENGKRLVAGVAQLTTQNWKYVPFPITFAETPLVFSQVTSDHELDAVSVQQRNASTQGFELHLKEQEGSNGKHIPEKVAWLAIEPGAIGGSFEMEAGLFANVDSEFKGFSFDQSFTSLPGIIGTVMTTNEADAVTPRFRNITTSGLEVQLDEETSKDPETVHASEDMAYLAVTPGIDLTDGDGVFFGETGMLNLTNAWVQVTLSHSYTKPVVLLGGLTTMEDEPVTIRVRNVTPNGFEVRLQEWGYQDGSHATESVAYIVLEGSIPDEPSYYCGGNAEQLEPGVNLIAYDNCDDQVLFEMDENSQLLEHALTTNRLWIATDDCGNVRLLNRSDTCIVAAVKLKARLLGAVTGPAGGVIMHDVLRQKELIPVLEPYSGLPGFIHRGRGGGETLDPALLDVSGFDAIVDWVFVEIRDGKDKKNVLATTSALLQRDGDVITALGDSVHFLPALQEGDYFVSIRHRNHLGVIREKTERLSSADPPQIDFSNIATAVSGGMQAGRFENGKRSLWAGDYNGDGKVIYQGPYNDVFSLFSRVLSDPVNTSNLANYIGKGYDMNDYNLDGNMIYQGPNNDRAPLLYHTVLSHPGNSTFLANFIASAMLP